MDIEQSTKILARLNYEVKQDKNLFVDSRDKIIYYPKNAVSYVLWYGLLIAAFNLCPSCNLNFFTIAYRRKFNRLSGMYNLSMAMVNGYHACKEKDEDLISDLDMSVVFHPHINVTLLDNFDYASYLFISKLLDDSDTYFNQHHTPRRVNNEDIRKAILDNIKVIEVIDKYGGVVGGSLGLAHYGNVYRNGFHDIDFILPLDALTSELIATIDEVAKIPIINQEKRDKEKIVPKLFMETQLYKDLASVAKDIEVVGFNIDQISNYDKVAKGVVILSIDGKDYDLIFRKEVTFVVTSCNGHRYKCQSLQDSIATKRLLERPKDLQDLINFKKYED